MTSTQPGPYVRGDTRVTMVGTVGSYPVMGCEAQEPISVRMGVCSSPPGSGIRQETRISHGAVNTSPGLVHTARQAMEAGGA